ncbi:MAG: hypothetical protein ABIU20_04680 [Blastocatellia bacterium]
MKRYFAFASLLVLLTTLSTVRTIAQEIFEDPEGKYTVTLPAGWIGIVNKDGLGRADVNIVFKVRENGALKIRRADDIDPKMELIDYAAKDESERVRFNPGYDKISMEKFVINAARNGALLAYDYKTTSGQPFTGRTYYLRTGDKTVYVLQFTGRKNILGTLRSHTDAIARSFKAKPVELKSESK